MKHTTKRLPAALAILAGVALAASLSAEQPVKSWPVVETTWTPDDEVRMITGDAVPTDPLPFIGITPCRLIDTRSNILPSGYGAPRLSEGIARSFIMTGQSHCFVPPGAQAVSINVTAANPNDIGNIRVYPASASTPNVSTVNFRPGQNTANAAIVALSPNGSITALVSFADTDLVVDINGYFGGALQTLRWKGVWSSSIPYGIDDVVSQDGSSYVSRISQNLGNRPSAGLPAWDLVAQKGATGSRGPAGSSPWSLSGTLVYYVGGSVGIGTSEQPPPEDIKLDVGGGYIRVDKERGLLSEGGGARIQTGPEGGTFQFWSGGPEYSIAHFRDSTGNVKAAIDKSGGIDFGYQKVCSVFIPDHWRDSILVPSSWTVAECNKLRLRLVATSFNLGCLFKDGPSFGTNGGGIPSPNCGW